jgi:lysophospholipase L1-like esterase
VLILAARSPAWADLLRIGVAGDSLSDPYSNYTGAHNPNTGLPFWGFGPNHTNWVEQLRALRGSDISILDKARAGDTSSDLLAQGEATAIVAQGNVRNAVIIIGANDVLAALQDPATTPRMLATLHANVDKAVTTLQASRIAAIVGNIPNLADTPILKAISDQATLTGIQQLVQLANQQIADVAKSHHVPLLDLYGLTDLTQRPLTLAGVTLTPTAFPTPNPFFAADFFHPDTVMQGLLANLILDAEQQAYGLDVSKLRLSDQEIVSQAGYQGIGPASYLNLGGYLDFTPSPEPSTLVLCGLAGLFGLIRHRIRRRSAGPATH